MENSYLQEREQFTREARSCIDEGLYERARALAEDRRTRYPVDLDAWLVIALCALRTGGFDEAIIILKQLAAIVPDWPPVSEYLGDAYRNKGMIREALEAYGSVLTPDVSLRERVTMKRAELLQLLAENGTRDDIGESQAALPHRYTIALADLYRKRGNADKAADILRRLLKDDPTNMRILEKAGEAERAMKAADAVKPVIAELSRWLSRLQVRRQGHG